MALSSSGLVRQPYPLASVMYLGSVPSGITELEILSVLIQTVIGISPLLSTFFLIPNKAFKNITNKL